MNELAESAFRRSVIGLPENCKEGGWGRQPLQAKLQAKLWETLFNKELPALFLIELEAFFIVKIALNSKKLEFDPD